MAGESSGADKEIELAERLGIPVFYRVYDMDAWRDGKTAQQLSRHEVEFTQHDTGAVRSPDVDDEAYELISPIAMRRYAATCSEGAKKYGAYNWEKGFAVTSLLRHAIAHAYKYLSGDRSEDHLGHGLWNFGAACHSEELWPHLNHDLRRPGCKAPQ